MANAQESVQAAIRHWNNAANWKWLRTTTDPITVSTGTSTYNLPGLFKQAHTVRITGNQARTLDYIDRRLLNKTVWRQTTQNVPVAYDLFWQDSVVRGQIRLFPIPSTDEEMVIDYYRQMVVPCSVVMTGFGVSEDSDTVTCGSTAGLTVGSPVTQATAYPTPATVQYILSSTSFATDIPADATVSSATATAGGTGLFLDIPADYEDGILAWATHHYLANKAQGGQRTEYWKQYSMVEIDRALRENQQDTPDHEVVFLPPEMSGGAILGPNDIRWADMNW